MQASPLPLEEKGREQSDGVTLLKYTLPMHLRLHKMTHWFTNANVLHRLFIRLDDQPNDGHRRRVRMIVLLSVFHLMLIGLVGLRFLADGALPFPVVVQSVVSLSLLILIYLGWERAAVSLLIATSVLSNFFALAFSDLTNLLYVVTAFVTVSVLLERRWRLVYALATVALVLVTGLLTAGQPQYDGVTHENVVMFAALGILSVTISTSVIDGDLRQLRRQMRSVRASEQRYRLLAENTGDMVSLHMPDGRFLYASPSYLRFTGYTEEELLAMPPERLSALVHPDDLPRTRQATHQQVLRGETITLEYRRRCKDGRYLWVEAHSSPILDADGNVVQIVLSSRDITERKHMEQALQAKHDELERFFTSALDLLCIADTSGYFLKVNPEWVRVLGYDRAELEGHRFLDFVHPDDLPATWQAIQDLANDQYVTGFVNRYRCKDGSYRFIEWRSHPYDNLIYAAARDITERVHMEEALRRSEAQLAEAQRIAQLGSWRWEVTTNMLTWSQEVFRVFGVEPATFNGNHADYVSVLHPDDREQVVHRITHALRDHQPYAFFHRIIHPHRGVRIIHARGNVVTDAQDNVLYLHGTAQDVTDLKVREEALRQSQQRLLTLINALPDVVARFDTQGTIHDISGNANHAVVWSELVMGRHLLELESAFAQLGLNIETLHEALRCIEQVGKGEAPLRTMEFQSAQPGGQTLDFEARFFKSGEDEVTALVRDVTEQKLSQRLQQHLTEELSSVNQQLQDFAYIISHDLKAPLRGINTVANWLNADYGAQLDAEGQQMLTLLNHRVLRMEAMINGVLEYSRIGHSDRAEAVTVDLDSLVREIIDDIAPDTPHRITLTDRLPTLCMAPVRARQVFQNLIDNAVKYMNKPAGEIEIGCSQQDSGWCFSIRDNGPGIDPRHHSRIFQIFRTLNPRDEIESTGIGLAIVKRIVESHGGKIWMESAIGQGSTFFFTLPDITTRSG